MRLAAKISGCPSPRQRGWFEREQLGSMVIPVCGENSILIQVAKARYKQEVTLFTI